MLDVLVWLLAVELLGLVAFPLLYVAVPWLPDRGYTFAKPFGLLLVFYPLWLLASSPMVPNHPLTILSIVVVLAAVSVWTLRRRQVSVQEFLRNEWPLLVLSELVFIGVFAVWAGVVAGDAAISHTEQPMDFAFLNSTIRSRHFPPQDPWLAGESVSYYYFGYLIFGGLVQLTGIQSAVGYNLALVLVAAMAATGIFGVAVNMVRMAGGGVQGATITGFLGVLLLLGISNLEGGLEFVKASGAGTEGFWQWVDIKGLEGPSASSSWYPSEAGWWWWRATRVIDTVEGASSLDYTITEFPFFSFLLGDLHPHVMSLPFVLAFVALVLNLFNASIREAPTPETLPVTILGWARRNAWAFVALALVLGALGFINLWDLPVFAALVAGAVLVKWYGRTGSVWRATLASLAVSGPIVVSAVIMYLPFYFTFDSQAKGVLPVDQYVSRPFHFLVVWGLFLLIVVAYLAWEFVSTLRRRRWRRWEVVAAALTALLPWVAWVLATITLQIARVVATWGLLPPWLEGLVVEGVLARGGLGVAAMVGGRLLHLAPLMLLLGVAVYVALRRVRETAEPGDKALDLDTGMADQSSAANEDDQPETIAMQPVGDTAGGAFPLLLVAVAMLLLMGAELFFVADLFGSRMNSVFKLSYQAWVLLALSCSYALYFLGVRYRRSGPVVRMADYGWIGLLVVGTVASVYYPAAAVYGQSSGFAGRGTLDGLAYVANSSPAELGGIRWLQDNYRPGDVIVEAVGDDYSEYGRVSASTGIPTVLGWTFHEEQWRGSREPFAGRQEAVQRFYQTDSIQEAREILDRYGVTYIFVGPREREKYGPGGSTKFPQLGDLVFPEGVGAPGAAVVIYRVRR